MLNSKLVSERNEIFADELQIAGEFKNKLLSKKWECSIGSVEVGQYVILPLLSPKKVKSEGYWMQNCVRQYIHLCKDGEYLLFSIQNLLGEKVATLGVKKHDNRWYFDDCLGKKNSTVIETTIESPSADHRIVLEIEYTEIFSVAHEVVRLLNCEKNT